MDLTLKTRVRTWFDEAVRLNVDCPADLRDRLLNVNREKHARLDLFLERLCLEFVEADKLCMQRGLRLKEKTMQTTAYDMTDFFIKLLIKEAKGMYDSDLAKAAERAKADAIAQAEDFLNGGKDNVYAEEGLVSEGEVKIKEL
jgi:hypothetical protein